MLRAYSALPALATFVRQIPCCKLRENVATSTSDFYLSQRLVATCNMGVCCSISCTSGYINMCNIVATQVTVQISAWFRILPVYTACKRGLSRSQLQCSSICEMFFLYIVSVFTLLLDFSQLLCRI